MDCRFTGFHCFESVVTLGAAVSVMPSDDVGADVVDVGSVVELLFALGYTLETHLMLCRRANFVHTFTRCLCHTIDGFMCLCYDTVCTFGN